MGARPLPVGAVGATTRIRAALALLACVAGLAACGENRDQRAARATVNRFYDALKQGDGRTVCALLSPAVADSVGRRAGATCVVGMRQFFRRVAASSDPDYFQSPPHVGAALVHGDKATVVLRRGPQRRRVTLRRVGDAWRITGSPDFQ